MTALPGAERRRTRTGLVTATVGLYLALLAVAPFGHHDLVCHLKSSTHCTTCVHASIPGDEARPVVVIPSLACVATLGPDASTATAGIDLSAQTDRSPPTR
jgi:hypothetical protein